MTVRSRVVSEDQYQNYLCETPWELGALRVHLIVPDASDSCEWNRASLPKGAEELRP